MSGCPGASQGDKYCFAARSAGLDCLTTPCRHCCCCCCRYLSDQHDATTIGVLLGMSACCRASADTTVARMLFLHLPARHPNTFPEIELSPHVQVGGACMCVREGGRETERGARRQALEKEQRGNTEKRKGEGGGRERGARAEGGRRRQELEKETHG